MLSSTIKLVGGQPHPYNHHHPHFRGHHRIHHCAVHEQPHLCHALLPNELVIRVETPQPLDDVLLHLGRYVFTRINNKETMTRNISMATVATLSKSTLPSVSVRIALAFPSSTFADFTSISVFFCFSIACTKNCYNQNIKKPKSGIVSSF